MAGVWPWMERRRLACGYHLGKLVVEVADKDTRRGQWALCGLHFLLRAGQLERLDRLGTWVGGTRPRWKQGGQSVWQEGGQVSTHLSTQRPWLWSLGGVREARGLQPALEGSGA